MKVTRFGWRTLAVYVTHTYCTYSIVGKDLLGILEPFIFRLGRDARKGAPAAYANDDHYSLYGNSLYHRILLFPSQISLYRCLIYTLTRGTTFRYTHAILFHLDIPF